MEGHSTVAFSQAFTDSVVQNACHDSLDRLQSARCLPDTQGYGILAITTWLQSSNTSNTQGILWLQGPIGSGKTTLLQTTAEVLLPPITPELDDDEEQEQKVVLDAETPPVYQYAECKDLGIHYGGTSYFFDNNLEDEYPHSDSGDRLFPTLAYGLARRLPPLAPFIISAFDNDPAIIQSSYKDQFDTLIFNPLQAWVTAEDGDIDLDLLLIIDGFDLCSTEESQVKIIEVIRRGYLKSIPGIRIHWVVGSRVDAWTNSAFFSTLETKIDEKLPPQPSSGKVTQLILPLPTDSEILSYLTAEFVNIRNTHPYFQSKSKAVQAPEEWPIPKELKSLTSLCDNLYLTAYSIIKYISKSNDPIQRLSQLSKFDSTSLYSTSSSSSSFPSFVSCSDEDPFKYLNKTYFNLLSKIPLPLRSTTKRILGAITCTQPSSQDIHSPRTCDLAGILGLSMIEFNEAIEPLYSIIFAPGTNENTTAIPNTNTNNSSRSYLPSANGERLRGTGIRKEGYQYHHHHLYVKGFQHRSFEQFLRNRSRSGDWSLDIERVHLDLASGCLRVFERYHQIKSSATQNQIDKGKGKGKEKSKEDEEEEGEVIDDRTSSCEISTRKLAEERWYIHCWRTGSGKGSGSGKTLTSGSSRLEGEDEEQSEASLALLNDLWGFDYTLLPKNTIVDRYFIEWLMDIQEETIPEDQLLKTTGPIISLELFDFFRSRTTNYIPNPKKPIPSWVHEPFLGDEINMKLRSDFNNVYNINNYIPPQNRLLMQESNSKSNQTTAIGADAEAEAERETGSGSELKLKLPPRQTYIIGSDPSKQMILIPMYGGKDCLREDLGNVKGPKDKKWDCIRCFWVVEKGDFEGVEVVG